MKNKKAVAGTKCEEDRLANTAGTAKRADGTDGTDGGVALPALNASRRLFLAGLGAALSTPLLGQSLEAAPGNERVGVGLPTGELHYTNPLQVAIADPYVLHAPDGQYYLYGTGGSGPKTAFPMYLSTDMVNWKAVGDAYLRAPSDSWAIKDFWAPEVFHSKGKYYMCYSAEWGGSPHRQMENFRIGIAVADSPAGPFRDLNNRPLFDPGYPIIDADLLFDDDGRIYLYFSRCSTEHPVESEIADWARRKGWFKEIEESWIYGVEVKPDFSGIIGEPTLLLRPPIGFDQWQDGWENRSVLSRATNRRWTEGPCSFKRTDKYYLMYSANWYKGTDYALGYATAEHPLGPFIKAKNNPVVAKNTDIGGDVMGTGHNCVAFSRDGKEMYCVYAARTPASIASGLDRILFMSRMQIDAKGILVVEPPDTGVPHPYPLGSRTKKSSKG